MDDRSSESIPTDAPPAREGSGSPVPAAEGAQTQQAHRTHPGDAQAPPQGRQSTGRRRLLIAALGVLVLAVALWFGIPWVQLTLNTVSTDDAYVNGHVTFVGARVRGQVARVLVDDNYRVRKGDLLVVLDKEPFQIAVAVKKAAVDTATADLDAAKAKVRGIEAEARGRRPVARPDCGCRQESRRARAGSA